MTAFAVALSVARLGAVNSQLIRLPMEGSKNIPTSD